MKRHAIRWAAVAGLLGGLALMTLLVVHFGAADVGHAIATAGWSGLGAIVGFHLALQALMGIGWWLLARGRRRAAPVWIFIWGRLLRDAGADLLPLSQVGGYVLGVRAVMLRGIGAVLGAATTVVDITLELAGQILYTALGIALFLQFDPHSRLREPLLYGLGIAVFAALGFVAAQRRRLPLLDRLAARLSQGWLTAIAAGTDVVQQEIRAIYRDGRGTLGCFGLHVITWLASTFEAWIALRLMGAPLGLGPVLAIESLLYAIRSAAFLVPNALGIQEGAYILLGAAFGLSPDVALALSLLKRARDIVIGVPALLSWQVHEGKILWAHRVAAPPAREPSRRPLATRRGERGAPP